MDSNRILDHTDLRRSNHIESDTIRSDMKKAAQKIKKLEMSNDYNSITINSQKEKIDLLER